MPYVTWDWAQSGIPNGSFSVSRVSPTYRSAKLAGYEQTRASASKDWWIWKIGWSYLTAEQFIYIIDFFHDHRGGIPFYIQWNDALFGLSGITVAVNPGGGGLWDSESAVAEGEGPIFLMRFNNDELTVEKLKIPASAWSLTIELRQL